MTFEERIRCGCALVWVGFILTAGDLLCAENSSFGPLYQDYELTLEPGHRTDILGPFFYFEQRETSHTWAFPFLMSDTVDSTLDYEEFHVLYPLLTLNRYGSEYRFQIFQLFSFSGGKSLSETNVNRFTLFPFYFQQRSPEPDLNYTAVFPIYGNLKNRFFRDETEWIMWPLYVKTRRRGANSQIKPEEFLDLSQRYLRARKGDITTYNFLVPFFHLRTGDQLKGWQFWPLIGNEKKAITHRTNAWDEIEIVGGHKRFFAVWPLYFNHYSDIGTTNAGHHLSFIPFYSSLRSPARDSTSYGWPLGLNYVNDRARQYREWDFIWPLIVFARGEGKTVNRVIPLFSMAKSKEQTRNTFLWPIYKYLHIDAPPLDRKRHRVLYFLYSDLKDTNTETGQTFHRIDLWPFFTMRKDFEGKYRLQVLALVESLVPSNDSIERNYSPRWALWRAEKNPKTNARSHSLLWNLYRYEATPKKKKCSFLFGLFQYQSGVDGKRLKLFYIPLIQSGKKSENSTPAH